MWSGASAGTVSSTMPTWKCMRSAGYRVSAMPWRTSSKVATAHTFPVWGCSASR